MAYLLVLSEEAVEDIDEIFGFGEHKFGKPQALHYLLGLEQHFEKLKFNPFIGRERNEIKVGLHSIPYVSHIIFYRILKNKIRIVRVLHGSRDLIKFL